MLAMFGVGWAVPDAQAGTITYVTPNGATTAGQPIDALAEFTTSSNTLTINYLNLISNPTSVVQNLSGLEFKISSGQTSGSLTSSAGSLRTVHSDGTYVAGGSVASGWKLSLESGMLELDILDGKPGPAHTIIGSPNSSHIYSNAMGSIAGNGPHNPFLAGTVDFVLDIPGLSGSSTVTAAEFAFGTTEEANEVSGVPEVGAPEPASVTLVVVSVAGLAAAYRCRSRFRGW
jgi:hypothetical protein